MATIFFKAELTVKTNLKAMALCTEKMEAFISVILAKDSPTGKAILSAAKARITMASSKMEWPAMKLVNLYQKNKIINTKVDSGIINTMGVATKLEKSSIIKGSTRTTKKQKES